MNNFKLGTRDDYEAYLKEHSDKCTFCDWPHEQIVLHEGRNWVWIYNRFPYWNAYTVIVPKRHIVEFTEVSIDELAEFLEMYKYALNRFREAGVAKKYILQWRLRDELIDSISGNRRPDHFHANFVADKDHLYDPTIDPNAINFDYTVLIDK